MAEITDQQLIDAQVDAANLAAIINGAASDPDVSLRLGGTAHTLRKTLTLAAAALSSGNITSGSQSVNLLDPTKMTPGALHSDGTINSSLNGFNVSDFMPTHGATQYTSNIHIGTFSNNGSNGYGTCLYDANKNFLVGDPLGAPQNTGFNDNANNTVHNFLATPTGTTAVYFRVYFEDSGQSVPTPVDFTTVMVVVGATLPGSFVAFGSTAGSVTGTAIPINLPNPTTPLFSGAKFGIIGDSISTYIPSGETETWQVKAARTLGATLAFQSYWAGRQLYHALDNSGNTGQSPITQTIAQSLDYLWLFLGTNMDSANGVPNATEIGTPADAPAITAYPTSMCANLAYVLEQLLSWNPKLRIIWITPYQSARWSGFGNGQLPSQTSINALQQQAYQGSLVCKAHSVPVIDLYNESGFNNWTNSTFTTDQLHPSAYGVASVIAPMIAYKTISYCKTKVL